MIQNPYDITLDDLEPEDEEGEEIQLTSTETTAGSPVGSPETTSNKSPAKPKHTTHDAEKLQLDERYVGNTIHIDEEEDEYAQHYQEDEQREGGLPSMKSVLCARLMVAGLAVLLLWVTSLNLAQVIVSQAVQSKQPHQVVDSWKAAYSNMKAQKAEHDACIERRLLNCNNNLNVSIVEETAEMQRKDNVNLDVVASVIQMQQLCTALYATKIIAVKQWATYIDYLDNKTDQEGGQPRSTDQIVFYHPEATCDNRSRAQLEQLFAREASPASVQQQSLTYGFLDEYEVYFQKAQDQMEARVAYDLGFLGNKSTQIGDLASGVVDELNYPPFPDVDLGPVPDLDGLIDCMSLAQGCTGGLRDQYDVVRADAQAEYESLKDVAVENKVKAEQTLAEMEAEVLTMQGFINDRNQDLRDVGSDLNAAYSGAGDALLNLPLPDTSYTPPVVNFGDVNVDVSAFSDVLDPDQMMVDAKAARDTAKAGVQDGITAMQDEAAQGSSAARSALDRSMTDTRAAIASLPGWGTLNTGYNPPEVDFFGNEENRTNATSQYLADNGALLDSTEQQNEYSLPQKPNITSNISFDSILAFGKTQSDNIFSFELFDFGYDLGPFLTFFLDVTGIILALDYLFRAYRSARLLVRYWGSSAVGLPIVDVREWKTKPGKTPMRVIVARLMTSPFTMLLGVFAVALIVVAAVTAFYIPLLDAYIQGCHETPPGSLTFEERYNGSYTTMLSRNTRSVFYNFASGSGAKTLAEGAEDYDSARFEQCSELTAEGADSWRLRQERFESEATQFAVTAVNQQRVQNCLRYETWYHYGDGADEQGTYFGLLNYSKNELLPPDRNLIQFLVDTVSLPGEIRTCGVDGLAGLKERMEPMEFNCTEKVPLCENVCTESPDFASIDSFTHKAACYSESMFHGAIVRGFLTVVVYIFWQISRVLLLKGVTRMAWRSLTPQGFTFMGSCDRDGKPIDGWRENLEVELKKQIKKFECGAYIYYLAATLCHVPYIILVAYFAKNLQYRGE